MDAIAKRTCEMWAFDRLPAKVRVAMHNTAVSFSAVYISDMVYLHGEAAVLDALDVTMRGPSRRGRRQRLLRR